ncbi:DUF7573 domain-containing protein [Natrononativus amylolyticus]|uniref:DUF7573 domain-containing protein n=1 Tax=Natrononativus amylolyticus TaxID=2963434 RepID=UPI0020CF3D7B|nr:hypothetical protein [Natrononativus amylolyticus]
MSEDRTLEEFASTDETSTTGPTDENEDGTVESVEPATPAYGWGSYTCDECGETTERVWWHSGGVVCPACKEW